MDDKMVWRGRNPAGNRIVWRTMDISTPGRRKQGMEALGVEQKDEASLGATIVFAKIKG